MKASHIVFSVFLVSQVLFAQSVNEWQTSFEKSGFISTSNYDETMSYFQKLADSSEYAEFRLFGISPQLRELKYLLVTKEKELTVPSVGMRVKELFKPTVLIINGIHSGEIEGKDASMILLREILITKEKKDWLDSLNILVVPIFNVDGHERASKFNRINQNGPEEMGWRTTGQNLNLNRDWMKADAPEMQAMLKLANRYSPDFVIDTHTTDGADYQYTITYSLEWSKNIDHYTGKWLKDNYVPFLEERVEDKGFLIHPYVFLKDWGSDLDKGLIYWPSTPRFSTGYFALQNRPSLLVETHMIKPYKERVYSTKAIIEATLEFVFNNGTHLKRINREADERSAKLYENGNYLPIAFTRSDRYELINFKGYEYYWDSSSISGVNKLVYTDKKKDFSVKYYNDIVVTDSVKVAKGYYIPPEYSYLLDKLRLHGISPGSRIIEERTVEVIRYKFNNVEFSNESYEGRQRVSFDYKTYVEQVTIPKGSFIVLTSKRTARITTHLLEPRSADSFVRWGFMNEIFERKEYYEDYVMEKIAEDMLAGDPELKREFETKLKEDEDFKNNPRSKLDFFYERSLYWDKKRNVYPILRLEK